eukprot:1953213-Amphidinium_carterae.1
MNRGGMLFSWLSCIFWGVSGAPRRTEEYCRDGNLYKQFVNDLGIDSLYIVSRAEIAVIELTNGVLLLHSLCIGSSSRAASIVRPHAHTLGDTHDAAPFLSGGSKAVKHAVPK